MAPVEGSRFGSNRPAPAAILWHCPACGAEQSGPIEQGCPACGNGTPGAHVGETTPAGKPRSLVTDATVPDSVTDAFTQWAKQQLLTQAGKYEMPVLYLAFKAGWEIAMSQQQTASSVLPLTGTPQSRTIRAALEFFREQILLNQPEEVTTGEWLSAEQVSQLLKEYEG